MEDDRRGANLTAAVANLSHNFDRLLNINGGVDSISSLPDEILHQILSFIPTKLAITTSVLSKRWRHVWCETPCLYFRRYKLSGDSISKTLASYTAAKITSLHVHTTVASKRDHHVDTLIEFAMTHNAELFSIELGYNSYSAYSVPYSFFRCASLKQLIVCSRTSLMIPRCIVSWTSLRNLSLTYCKLSDASFSKMLSGSPMLETLTLNSINSLEYLDLSDSMRLKRLDIDLPPWVQEPMQIVAPHIHSLRLRTLKFLNDQSQSNCTLVDVSSLTEANIDFLKFLPEIWCNATGTLKAAIHDMVQTMLEKLLNVEKLTLGVSLLQMLSIAEVYGVPLPTFNVKTLTLETRILRSVAPGIARLLQNSPELKKITIYAIDCFTEVDKCVNGYLDKQDLNPDQCSRLKDVVSLASWEREVAEPKLVASFVELLLANTRSLETLVLRFGSFFDKSRFGELSQITHTLPHNSNVSIVIK